MAAHTLRRDRVTFDVIWHPEDVPFEGNCSAIDPSADLLTEEWIQDQLDSGNEWAWCCIEVRASVGTLSESAFLGCCSYRCKEDFMMPYSGYFEDMCDEAFERLCQSAEVVCRAME